LEGYCHVMAMAWHKLIPDSRICVWYQLLENVDWEDLPQWKQELDDPFDVIHVWCEDAQGHAYDALGKHDTRSHMIQAWEQSGGTQWMDSHTDWVEQVTLKDIKKLIKLGELKPYNAAQLTAADTFIQDHLITET
jgi:hypothetical protein